MLYFQFWNSFLEEWANLEKGDARTPAPAKTPSESETAEAPASSATPIDAFSPKEKYEYLSEYGTQILCLLTADYGCSYLSKNFEKLTGQDCESLQGHRFYRVIHEDFQDRLRELLATRPQGDKPRQFRCKIQHDDSNWYWYLFLIHPKHNGERGEFVCIIENIHESILTQNTLQKARLEAELALRARSEFLANMSHELRTPLNAVIGFSQIIESEMFGKIENPQYLEYTRHIQESGYDLLTKIEDLLEIANIDAGRVTLAREEVHLSDILRHVMEAQTHHANSAQVTLHSMPIEADLLLYVDRLKLQHILGHLVSNAIKFSGPGASITLEATLTPSQELKVCVADTGTGMTDIKRNAIVRALQEENCWIAAPDSRTIGIGLALTREFVALHGGTVDVASQPGIGTTVTISLPPDCLRSASAKKAEYLRQMAN